MTTTTVSPMIPALDPAARRHAHINLARIIRSEFFKLTHLRSTWIMLGLMLLSNVGLTAVLFLADDASEVLTAGSGHEAAAQTLNLIAAITAQISVIFVIMFGVLAVSAEFSSGMMRATLSAAPRRLAVLAAKTIAAAGLTAATTCLSLVAAIPLALAVRRSKGVELQLEVGQTLQSVGGMVFFVVAMTVLGLFFGAILRSTAGGISASFGLVWVVPIIFTLVPIDFLNKAIVWLPDQGAARASNLPIPGEPVVGGGPLGGLIAALAWLVVAGGIAAYLTRRRDA